MCSSRAIKKKRGVFYNEDIPLYLDNGYLNVPWLLDNSLPWILMWGARGIGKTYGVLKYLYEHDEYFILLRRKQNQVDMLNKPEFQPFKKLNEDFGWCVDVKPISKYHSRFYVQNGENDIKELGLTMALTTVTNIRGFDASDVKVIFYDEFIPETIDRPIKGEGEALLNAYETINRNRELNGGEPVKFIGCANSNRIDNEVFLSLGIVDECEKMAKKHISMMNLYSKGLTLINAEESPISRLKADTQLYRLTRGNDFSDMALDNSFRYDDRGQIKSKNLAGYKPVCVVGEICIYENKSDSNDLYVTTHKSGTPVVYGTSEVELKKFQRDFQYLKVNYFSNDIQFEKALCEILFCKYLKVL